MMNVLRDGCPTDLREVAEMYCLGTLPPEDAAVFGNHCFACSRCAGGVQVAFHCVRAVRATAQNMQSEAARLRERVAAGPDVKV